MPQPAFLLANAPTLTLFRIEDDILITDTGYENLTTAIKNLQEVEAAVSSA